MINRTRDRCTSNGKTVLAIHLFVERKVDGLFSKLVELIELADEVWLSSSNNILLEKAQQKLSASGRHLRCFHVDNRWHDWSGYLSFLQESHLTNKMIICNDSIVSRRVISSHTMELFYDTLKINGPVLIGELDTTKCSVDLNGWSSTSWVSTYLFSIQGLTVDVPQLVTAVEADVDRVLHVSQHFFNDYLNARRTNLVSTLGKRRAKLGAMFFERRLTRLVIESGLPIINFCAGSLIRKAERIIERARDS